MEGRWLRGDPWPPSRISSSSDSSYREWYEEVGEDDEDDDEKLDREAPVFNYQLGDSPEESISEPDAEHMIVIICNAMLADGLFWW
jgi:hypothetical protein